MGSKREVVELKAAAISKGLQASGLQVALEIDEGDWEFEDFSLMDAYITDNWPDHYPIRIRIATDEPARLSALTVKLLWARYGGAFWVIGEPPEPPAVNVREPVERVIRLILAEMG